MSLILEREGVALNAAERNKRNENLTKIENAINAVGNAVPEAQAAKLLAEEAKAQAVASEEKSANVQEQINQLVIEGDSSVEAAQARVSVDGTSHVTLKERLDVEHQDLTGKLAETVQSVSSSTEQLNDMRIQVDSVTSGTPKIIVQSISELPSTVTDEKLALVLDDGHKYYHNGSTWVDGGLYQAIAEQLPEDDYSRSKYLVTVQNTLNVDYEERVIKIAASFEQGECKKDSNIVVTNDLGYIIPHQWEDDRYVNEKLDRNMGRYPDGSLKNGYIYIVDSITAAQTKSYKVFVYTDKASEYLPNVSSSKTAALITLSVSNLVIRFPDYNKFLSDVITDAGVSKTFQQDPVYNNAMGVALRLASDVNTTIKSSTVKGNGVVFKEFELVLTNSFFDFTITTKLYKNKEVEVKSHFKAKRLILSTEVFGMMNRINFKIGTSYTTNYANVYSSAWVDTTNRAAHIMYAHGDTPRDDPARPSYPVYGTIVASSGGDATIKRFIAGWQYATGNPVFDIPEGEVFVTGMEFNFGNFSGIDINEMGRAFNKLIGRISNKTKLKSKSNIMNMISENIFNALDDYEENYNGDVAFLGRLAMWKMYGVSTLSQISSDYKAWVDAGYGSGDAETMWQLFTEDRIKLQVSSRFIPMAEYLLKEFRALNNTAEIAYYEKLLKSYAEMICRVYEERGYTPLRYVTNSYVTNSIAAGLRGLSMGLKLEPTNTRWLNAYNGNELNFNNCIPVKNIFTDGVNQNLSTSHYIHYVAYAFFEYQKSLENLNRSPLINLTSYPLNTLSAYGAIKEQEFCISSSRRGLGHTLAYVVYLLTQKDDTTNLAQAEALMERLIEQNNPTGGHEFPLEDWRYEPAQPYLASIPYEMQVLAETMYLLLDQNIRTKY